MSTRWCCRILQEEFGPMDLDELRALAISGTLGPGDLVRREAEDVWGVAKRCPELRDALRTSETAEPTQTEPSHPLIPPRIKMATEKAILKECPATDATATESDAPANPTVESITAHQCWIAGSLTAGLMLLLFFVSRLMASPSSRFPLPRRTREQFSGLQWFFGTGPWMTWEITLIWFDTLMIFAFVSTWLVRRLAR